MWFQEPQMMSRVRRVDPFECFVAHSTEGRMRRIIASVSFETSHAVGKLQGFGGVIKVVNQC